MQSFHSGQATFGGLPPYMLHALDPAPGRFRRLRAAAGRAVRERRGLTELLAATADDEYPLVGWSSGPAGVRASIVIDGAMEAAAREAQLAMAHEAMRDQFEADDDRDLSDFYNRERLITHLIERAARDTRQEDGELSTFITAADLVDLAAEFVPIDDWEDALFEAENALRDYHRGWREPTKEEAEVAAADAEMEAFLAADRILAEMPAGGDLANALMGAHPHLTREAAADIAGRTLARHSTPPVRRLEFGPNIQTDPFDTYWAEPDVEALALHEKARAISQGHQVPSGFDLQGAALDLEMRAQEVGTPEGVALAAAMKRERLGMNAPFEADEPESEPLKSDAHLTDLCTPPGLVGEIVDWMEASSDRPNRALLLGAALTFVGTLAGRKFATPSNLRSNNYVVTLAPSGHGKDHALGRIKTLAAAAGLDRYVGPARIMSASALRKLVTREPAVGCYMDEFGGFMGQVHDRRAGLHNAMIRYDMLEMFSAAGTFFAGAEYAGEPAAKVFAPNFSISGTSTPEAFWSSLSSLSASDGLLARLILLDVTGPKPARVKPRLSPGDVPASLIDAVRALAGTGGNLASIMSDRAPTAVTVPLDEEAEAIDEERRAELDAAESAAGTEAMPFLNRVREHALKLALVVAVGCNPGAPVITGPILEWAYRLARLSAATLIRESADRIADNERGDAMNRILRMIRNVGDAGVTAGKIADKQRGVDARLRDQILRDLVEAGRIRLDRQSGTGGRARERYVAT